MAGAPDSEPVAFTPETARRHQHWHHHGFSGVRPFFCQAEAVETAIWLTEVAPGTKHGKRLLDHLAAANKDANPELMRLALETEGQMIQRVMPDLMGIGAHRQ